MINLNIVTRVVTMKSGDNYLTISYIVKVSANEVEQDTDLGIFEILEQKRCEGWVVVTDNNLYSSLKISF